MATLISTNVTGTLDILNSSSNIKLLRLSHPTSPTTAGGFLGFNSDGTTNNMVVTLGVQYSSNYYNVINIKRDTRNVGIGTANPVTPLHVSSTATNIARFSGLGTAGTYIKLDEAGTQAWVIGIDNGNTALKIRKNDYNGDVSMTFTSDGNVGIGTTNPSAKIDVVGASVAGGAIHSLFRNSADANSYLRIENNYSVAAGFSPKIAGYYNGATQSGLTLYSSTGNTTSTTAEPVMGFEVGTIAAGASQPAFQWLEGSSPRMTIDKGGKVGIGTVSPNYKLHIVGGAGVFDVTGAATLNHHLAVTEVATLPDWRPYAGTTTVALQLQSSATRGILLAAKSTGNQDFYNTDGLDIYVASTMGTSSSNRGILAISAKIDGNVGIGTVDPGSKLHVIEASTGEAFRVDGASSGFAMIVEGGTSYKTRMRGGVTIGSGYGASTPPANGLIVEGNVGIGTASPNYKLEVDGTTDFGGTTTYNNGAAGLISWNAGTKFKVKGQSGHALSLGANGTEDYVWIATDGNVGIGTNAPAQLLHVYGLTQLGAAGKTEGGAVLNYASFGEVKGGAQTLLGNAVVPGTANNTIQHSKSDAGNFVRLKYNTGICFHTNVTSTINTDIAETTNERVRIDLTGNLLISDGLVGAPSLSFINDTNTGMWRPGSDQLRLTTGGTDAIIIDGSQNVGIGTVSPAYGLDNNRTSIRTNSNTAEKVFSVSFPNSAANQKVDISFPYFNGTLFWGYLEVTITSSYSNQLSTGKITKLFSVGLNTPGGTSGNYTPQIYDNTNYYTSVYGPISSQWGIEGINFNTTTGQYYITIAHRVSTGNGIRVSVKAYGYSSDYFTSNRFGGLTAGSVYTTDATVFDTPIIEMPNLKVYDSIKILSDSSSIDASLLIGKEGVETTEGTKMYYDRSVGWTYIDHQNNSSAYGLRFRTRTSGTALDTLTLVNGNVGIGTAVPSQKLHVQGNLRVTGAYYASDNNAGSSNQVLTSTGSGGTDWKSLSQIGDTVTGSGTTNKITKWSDGPNSDLTDSSFLSESGTTLTNTATATEFTTTNTELRLPNYGRIAIGAASTNSVLLANVGDNATFSNGEAVIKGENSGNRGTVGHASGSDLLRLNFSDALGMILNKDGHVGIGTDPKAKFEVDLNQTSGTLASDNYAHFGGQHHTSGSVMGITLGYREANLLYRKVGIVARGLGDNAARQDLAFLVSTATGSASVTPADAKLTISGLTGNVGIGTNDPDSKLHIAGSGGDVKFTIDRTDARTYSIYTESNSKLHIRDEDASADRLTILSDGNVGIGAVSPNHKLQVDGSVSIRPNGGSNDQHYFTTGGLNNTQYVMYDSAGTAVNRFRTDNYSYITGGNVGIGTAVPSQILHVQGNLRVTGAYYASDNNAGSSNQVLTSTGSGGTDWKSISDISDTVTGSGTTNYVTKWSNGANSDLTDSIIYDGGTNVGIGTPSPNTKLNIKGDQSADGQLYIEPTNDGEYAGLVIKTTRGADRAYGIFAGGTGTDDLNFRFRDATAGADRMVIDSSGEVGIGTIDPSSKLHIYGADNTSTKITLTNTAPSPNNQWSLHAGYNDQSLRFLGDSTTVMTLLDSGNVGIGTISPSRNLEVYKSGGAEFGLTAATSGVASSLFKGRSNSTNIATGPAQGGSNLTLYNLDTTDGNFNGIGFYNSNSLITSSILGVNISHSSRHGALVFQTHNGSSLVERMRIDEDGNVGIGNTNPKGDLHVSTTGNYTEVVISSVVNATSGSYLRLTEGANDWGSYGYLGGYIQYNGNDNLIIIGRHNTNGTTLTDDIPAITIKRDNGNVGIGTTAPDATLHVRSASSSVGLTVGNTTGDTRLQITSTEDSDVTFNVGDTSGMGTSRDLIIKTGSSERMRIASTGNVGIGTVTPSAKLHVAGNTYLNSGSNVWNLIGNNGIDFARETYFGYSSSYRILQLGTVGATRAISIGVDVSSNASGSFGGDEIILPNQREIITPNAADNGYLGLIATDNQNKVRIGNYRWNILGDTPGITIDTSASTNYVGIGTTSPGYKLHVSSPTTSAAIGITGSGGSKDTWSITSSDNSLKGVLNFRDEDSSTTVLTLRQDGFVGIGTAVPSQILHVQGNLRVTGAFHDSNNEAGASDQVLTSTGSGGTDWKPLSGIGVTGVTSATTNQLTINQSSPAPALNIVTAAVADGGTALATGNQIYDFVIGLSYITASSASALTNKTGAISQWTNDSGYITASSASALTNKTGAISQWTNDENYSTTTGTVTGVTSATTNQLTINQSSPAPALNIVTAAVANDGTALATGNQIYDFVIGLNYITASSTSTLTNKSGNISQWTNDSNYSTTTGTVTGTGTDGYISRWNDASVTADASEIENSNVFQGANGNVGIGTTSNLSQKLHVQGDLRVTGAIYDNSGVAGSAGSNGQLLSSTGSATAWTSAGTGTVTSVTSGTGLSVLNGTSTPLISLNLPGMANMTEDWDNTADYFIVLDGNNTQKKKLSSQIFGSNGTTIPAAGIPAGGDSGQVLAKSSNTDYTVGWTSAGSGTITEVIAGNGLNGGGTTGAVTVNIDSNVCQGIKVGVSTAVPSTNLFNFVGMNSVYVTKTGSDELTFDSSGPSDYRLKKNVSIFTSECWQKIKEVDVRKFDFNEEIFESEIKSNNSQFSRLPDTIKNNVGFYAHELEVIGLTGAVIGEKDAVDEDGNPIYQKVNFNSLIPVLWGALKDAISKIETLEGKVKTLENKE